MISPVVWPVIFVEFCLIKQIIQLFADLLWLKLSRALQANYYNLNRLINSKSIVPKVVSDLAFKVVPNYSALVHFLSDSNANFRISLIDLNIRQQEPTASSFISGVLNSEEVFSLLYATLCTKTVVLLRTVFDRLRAHLCRQGFILALAPFNWNANSNSLASLSSSFS